MTTLAWQKRPTENLAHLAWCILAAVGLARQEGKALSALQTHMFIMQWLLTAQKHKLFIAEYRYVYQRAGDFPDDEETALEFDIRLNNVLRSRKDGPEYWEASEKMLEYWLVVCAGKSDAEAARSLATIRHAKRHL